MNKMSHSLNNDKKSSLREKRIMRAKQEKLARLLKSGVSLKMRNIQGFTFNK